MTDGVVDVAQWLKHQNSDLKKPGFNPSAGEDDRQFSWPSCADFCLPDPPLCVWHAPKLVHMLIKEPVSMCHKIKRVGLTQVTATGKVTQKKTAHTS